MSPDLKVFVQELENMVNNMEGEIEDCEDAKCLYDTALSYVTCIRQVIDRVRKEVK